MDLVIENADIGVDRSMLADVRDALVHLLRNAVDHGLESPETRAAAGQAATGRIRIRVRVRRRHAPHPGGGRRPGHRPRAAEAVAVNKRLITQAQAAALSEREAIELIFRPGFSTREQVSEISGRGVGMDVVKRKVETLGGSVGVASRIGRGTTITLRLPQSLALMKVLLVRLGDDVYGIPAADVVAVMRVKPEDRMEVFGTLAVKHRGKPTALVALGPLLGVNGGNRFDKPPAVVVRHGDDHAALVVDGFVDEREVAVKPCGGDFLKGAPFIAGTAALEDGRVAVLLPRAGHHGRGAPHGAPRHPAAGLPAAAGAAGGRLAHRPRHRGRARQGAGPHRGGGAGRRGGVRQGAGQHVRSHPHRRADAEAWTASRSRGG